MLDGDLARLYATITALLNEKIKSNIPRFPADFAFRLTTEEFADLKLKMKDGPKLAGRGRFSKHLPRVFTDPGVAMLSCVLRSTHAASLNVAIIRAFVRLRRILESNGDLARILQEHDPELAALPPNANDILPPIPTYFIRGANVMVDGDLARFYGTTLGRINELCKRNMARFPNDFAFPLTPEEFKSLMSHNPEPNTRRHRGYPPWGFTDQGAAMLASVLRSKPAIQMNLAIVRTVVRLRQTQAASRKLARAIQEHDRELAALIATLDKFLTH